MNLEIALSGVSAKIQSAFQWGRKCAGTSGDVIKATLTVLPRRAYWTLVLCLYGDIKAVCVHGDLTKFAPRKDHYGVGEQNVASNAISYTLFRGRSHHPVIRVYDEAGDVIETQEHAGD